MSKKQSLASIIDSTRFETIEANLALAVAELKSAIAKDPFKVEYTIYAGCPNTEITREVAYRFVVDGVAVQSGKTISGAHYLTIKRDLPRDLVHLEQPEVVVAAEVVEVKEDKVEEPKKTTRVTVKTVKK